MLDKALNRLGIGLALLFMVTELSYVNAKSLLYLAQGYGAVDRFFAVTGSLAFSMVTVVVMRKGAGKWIKIVFPLFDVALVFCGFNLKFAESILDGSDNPVRFWLTIFMAAFTGLITYSLGIINYSEHTQGNKSETNKELVESKRIVDETNLKLIESNCIIDELKAKQVESDRIIEELTSKQNDTIKKLVETKSIAAGFLRNHILYESWLGKKKSESNRNGHESLMNQLAERVKQGETISFDEFLKKAR